MCSCKGCSQARRLASASGLPARTRGRPGFDLARAGPLGGRDFCGNCARARFEALVLVRFTVRGVEITVERRRQALESVRSVRARVALHGASSRTSRLSTCVCDGAPRAEGQKSRPLSGRSRGGLGGPPERRSGPAWLGASWMEMTMSAVGRRASLGSLPCTLAMSATLAMRLASPRSPQYVPSHRSETRLAVPASTILRYGTLRVPCAVTW